MKKAIIISGPTASGKSSLALQMVDFADVAIINADALQVYEGLPILSSQPSVPDIKIAPHFLYSHFKAEQSCSVGLWLELVRSTLEEVWKQNKIPLVVGGSGMYISKLIDGISEIPAIEDDVKIEVSELYKSLSREEFVRNLVLLGEDSDKLKNLDRQRLTRAYEVIRQTGKSISWWQNQPAKKIFDPQIFTHVNLNPPREQLYKNCNLRFEAMLKSGALEEVRALIDKDLQDDSQITKTLGFLEIKDFLQERIKREKMIEIASQRTRNYAKRQLTWFRHQFAEKNTFDSAKLAYEFLQECIRK